MGPLNHADAGRYDASRDVSQRASRRSPRGISGGMWPSPPEGHNLVQLFVEVDDIDAYIAKATGLGATVIVPKSELPDGDALAIVLDPAGLSFGLYRPKPAAL